jgi:hypothetical protein
MTAEQWIKWAWDTLGIILPLPYARRLAASGAHPDDPASMFAPLSGDR